MSNRLPETDLANWSFLSADAKRRELEKFERPKQIIGSYEPFRRVFPDAVNQQLPLFGESLSATSWVAIESRLIRECKGDEQKVRMNRGVLSATHEHARKHAVAATAIDVAPLTFAGAASYHYGTSLVFHYRDHAAIAFLDLRRSNRLSSNGIRFVFSALHHRFREAYSDLADVRLEVWRYGTTTQRRLTTVDQLSDVIEWEELEADVRETHAIWEQVKRGFSGDRRRAAGGAGPLFD